MHRFNKMGSRLKKLF